MSAPAVKVSELAYTFAGRETPSLAGISLTLEPGSWTLIAGRTGSGKSTLLRAMAGLIPHHAAGTLQGRVELCGLDTRRATTAELARTVGIVFQSPDDQICSTTVAAEVAFGLENLAVAATEIGPRIAAALERRGLARFAEARTAQLSGGQKQRLLLASILAMEPKILLLDEPLSQLDRATAAELLATLDELRAQGLTIITAEHRLDEIIDHAELQAALKTPICLDECLRDAHQAGQAIRMKACRIINIKLGRVGGFGEAKRLHDVAQAHGIPVWCGGMLEAGIGRAHNVALASMANFTLPGDVSASKRYWKRDIIEPWVETTPAGTIALRDEPGFGYAIDHDFLNSITVRAETVA